jgi:Ca2+-binding RTX toxin-like protein
VSSAAVGAIITVTGNYVATAATSNNLSVAAVAMTGLDGVDINMSAATGNFGFTIDSGNTAATLQGSSKADAITGAAGNDSLVGNAGDDVITPAAGADTISAGAGNDSIVFTGANLTALDSIDGGTGTDSITVPASATSSPDFDRISNLTSIRGTNDAGDTTVAIAAITETTAQVITITSIGDAATKGLVTTNAAASATTTFSMVGATGDDFLIGSNGADTLSAAAGADTLQGGAGADSIVAGIGVDKVRVTTAITADTITGFKANGADLLEHSVAALNAAGGAVTGAVTVMGDGLSAPQVGAGAAAFLALDVTAGGKTSLTNAELINVTNGGAGFADLGALETAMVGTNGLVTGGTAMVATDGMLFQYLNSTTSTFRTGVLRFDLGVGTTTNLASTDISLFETADVGAAALVTADTTYIA